MALYGEVEAVVGEEGHVDLPVLLGHQRHGKVSVAVLGVPFRSGGGLPAGGEGRRASGTAGGRRQSRP